MDEFKFNKNNERVDKIIKPLYTQNGLGLFHQ